MDYESDYIKGTRPQPTPKGSEVVSIRAVVSLDANLAANDMIGLCYLPEDCVPVEAVIDNEDLDSNATETLALDFGLANSDEDAISTAAADGGDEWIDGGTFGQDAGMTRMTTRAMYTTQPSSTRRKVAIKVATVAATKVAGDIAVTFSYRAAYQGE